MQTYCVRFGSESRRKEETKLTNSLITDGISIDSLTQRNIVLDFSVVDRMMEPLRIPCCVERVLEEVDSDRSYLSNSLYDLCKCRLRVQTSKYSFLLYFNFYFQS